MLHFFFIFLVILLLCPSFSIGSQAEPLQSVDNANFQKELETLTEAEDTIKQCTGNLQAFKTTLDNQNQAAQLAKEAKRNAQEIKTRLNELEW